MNPLPSFFKTFANSIKSSSSIRSVIIGVPSESRCTELSPSLWAEIPKEPASIDSSMSLQISFLSSSLHFLVFAASLPITYIINGPSGVKVAIFTPFGVLSMLSINSGWDSQSQGIPSFIVSNLTASFLSIVFIEASLSSSLQGANPKPQLPMVTVVIPCQLFIVHQGSQKTCESK